MSRWSRQARATPERIPIPRTRPRPSAPAAGRGSCAGCARSPSWCVTALVISALVRTFLLQAFWVPSGSMEETLIRGDRILVWKPGGDPGHGDVVVFKDPADWLADPIPQGACAGAFNDARGLRRHSARHLGRRPGQAGHRRRRGHRRVLLARRAGSSATASRWTSPTSTRGLDRPGQSSRSRSPMGRVFVMGDHRSDSADSRFHLSEDDGTVPLENVVGTAERDHVADLPLGDPARLRRRPGDRLGCAARARSGHEPRRPPSGASARCCAPVRSTLACVDEVGRGALAGPVSVGVVVIDLAGRRRRRPACATRSSSRRGPARALPAAPATLADRRTRWGMPTPTRWTRWGSSARCGWPRRGPSRRWGWHPTSPCSTATTTG